MTPVLDVSELDLGKDRERISQHDALRQTATVNHILRAFCGPLSERREVQVLADEVGMGKTYVALAAAYSLLSVLRDKSRERELGDLANCYKCVLVITPGGNGTLAEKWDREDDALLTRCAVNGERTRWFRSVLCDSADQLLQAIYRANDLRRRDQPVLLVAQSNIFTKRLSDSAVRFVTACLFRWWGNGLRMRERYHIVRGLSQTVGSWGWEDAAQWAARGEYDIALWDWTRHERFLSSSDSERTSWEPRWERHLFADVSVTYDQMARALERFENDGGHEELEELRQTCNSVPLRQPRDRRTVEFAGWKNWFRSLKNSLRDIFKQLWKHLLDRALPLVISDEAHHWRNNEAGEFRAIRDFIAPYARRLLLLTATPFQLNPDETINILKVIDHMEPAIGRDRVRALQHLRDRLGRCMASSKHAGQNFSREWGALTEQLSRWKPELADATIIPRAVSDPRTEAVREIWTLLRGGPDRETAMTLDQVPGPIRPFFGRAIELSEANESLRQAMSPLIIRHRRSTNHRRYWVGREYPPTATGPLRPDHSRLHIAPGQSLDPKDELVQYLLMKVVAAQSKGRHRTALGTALTGCYSTMWQSKEGRATIEAAARGGHPALMELLYRLTGMATRAKDGEHPKLRRVAETLLDRWDRGEKSLVFCFRKPTADALYRTLSGQIEQRLRAKQEALFEARGTERKADRDKAMQQFRRSLTARESSGVPLFVDRVLAGWLSKLGLPVPELSRDDIGALAALAARAELNGRQLFPDLERADRVFLGRAIEHVLARRLASNPTIIVKDTIQARVTKALIDEMSQESWVRDRYGLRHLSTGGEGTQHDATERAARSSLAAHYDLVQKASGTRVQQLAGEMISRFESGRSSVFTSLTQGPNLFAPSGPALAVLSPRGQADAELLNRGMFAVTLREERWDWPARRDAVDAIVRALLRDDLLLRMPTTVFSGVDETWASSLFAGLHQPLSAAGGGETLAQRIVALLEELGRMSEKERAGYLEYSMNPKAEAVALVKGETKNRTSVFSGFNTPLLPEILICTAVGQEGIDLHRECRHVVHYDLGWNPATIEQRTGRTDRIGSKTERERRLAVNPEGGAEESHLPGLEVALPYLAATYDERMFEALRTRAQVFDILTGGDPTADRVDQNDWALADDEGTDPGLTFVPLPQEMLDSLKVDLGITPSSGTQRL